MDFESMIVGSNPTAEANWITFAQLTSFATAVDGFWADGRCVGPVPTMCGRYPSIHYIHPPGNPGDGIMNFVF